MPRTLFALAFVVTCCSLGVTTAGEKESTPLAPTCITPAPQVANGSMVGHRSPGGCLSASNTSCCENGCGASGCNGECCESESGSWLSGKSRAFQRWWYRCHQSKKHLQHPEHAPHFHQTWGYHQTCWRTFPPACNVCPPVNSTHPGYAVPPPVSRREANHPQPAALEAPASSEAIPASVTIPARKATTSLPIMVLDREHDWAPTRTTSDPR